MKFNTVSKLTVNAVMPFKATKQYIYLRVCMHVGVWRGYSGKVSILHVTSTVILRLSLFVCQQYPVEISSTN